MKIFALVASLTLASSSSANAQVTTYSSTVLVDRVTTLCTLIKPTAEAQHHREIDSPSAVVEKTTRRQNRTPQEILAQETDVHQDFVTVLGGSPDAVEQRVAELCVNGVSQKAESVPSGRRLRGDQGRSLATVPTEVRKIVDSGDPSNRIDVVFMGDGYTLDEKTRFFDDIARLTHDMFTGDTFAQYLPLFNIWAAYVPSVESGIGVGSKPRNTAFGLYRDGTELRGVYTSKTQAARDVCTSMGKYACDFPSLIGNDEFYGGLGGEFVISTRSPTSGTIVLRHEMGHNFGSVGEEYDGGYVYSGANSVGSIAALTWKHWLTEPTRLVEEQVAQLYQKHIWYDLKQGAYKIDFTSTGKYSRWYLQFSVSGTDTDNSLSVTLDGQPLEWKSNGLKDRSFYQWSNATSGFSTGSHQLVIQAGAFDDSPIIKQLCNAVIYEYADESGFKQDDRDFIGMYPTWDINKKKTLRPDNERCVMRNMTSSTFCSVCQENMWLQFLGTIEFIDTVAVDGRNVSVQVIPLGQFRLPTDTFVQTNPSVAAAEKYTIQWLRGTASEELVQFRDALSVDLSAEPAGDYTVRVEFSTPSVRQDPRKYMQSEKKFTIA